MGQRARGSVRLSSAGVGRVDRGGAGESSTRASGLADHRRAQRARARRRARRGRARRARLPPGPRLDGRRIPRRRGLLHPQRLPDHPAPAGRAVPHRAASTPGRSPRRGRGGCCPRSSRASSPRSPCSPGWRPTAGLRGRRAGLAALRPELAPRAGRAAVLGGVRAAVAAAAPVVAVGGGAAVPAVAAPAGRGAGDGAAVHRAARHGPAGVRLGAADGAALRPRRRLAGLLRHRRPRVRVPGRRGAGVGVAAARVVARRCRAWPAGASTPPGSRRWSRSSWGSWRCRSSTQASTRRAGSCGSGCSPRC